MNWHKKTLEIATHGKGLHDITDQVRAELREWGVQEGICFLFLPHTSASLVMSENWDPTARADLETFMERLVPDRDDWYTHDLEGPDDDERETADHEASGPSRRDGGLPRVGGDQARSHQAGSGIARSPSPRGSRRSIGTGIRGRADHVDPLPENP